MLRDRHRSREFVVFLEKLDAAYPTDTAIKLILDNHSAQHLQGRPRRGWQLSRRTVSPLCSLRKHGSWLNLVEGFFSKMTRVDASRNSRRFQG